MELILQLLNTFSSLGLLAATILLLRATHRYTTASERMADASRRTAEASETAARAQEASTEFSWKPILRLSAGLIRGRPVVQVWNVGLGAAKDVTVTLEFSPRDKGNKYRSDLPLLLPGRYENLLFPNYEVRGGVLEAYNTVSMHATFADVFGREHHDEDRLQLDLWRSSVLNDRLYPAVFEGQEKLLKPYVDSVLWSKLEKWIGDNC